MRSGEEIRTSLAKFVAKWTAYDGTERAEAQTFLNELFGCYGSDRAGVGARLEHFESSAGFMDLFWPGVVIFEMKAPGKAREQKHLDQLHRYWMESSDLARGIEAAPWVVLCNFKSFEIWAPGRFPNTALKILNLADLPANYDALMFLAGKDQEPNFGQHDRELTAEAVTAIAALYESLADRAAATAEEISRFILQSVWCLFAEDIGMIGRHPLQTLAQRCLADPTRSTAADIGQLFRVLNRKGDNLRTGALMETRFVNGELFAQPAEVDLTAPELRLLLTAAEYDWTQVDPTIFGSLMEGVLGRDRRWALGAHYTHEADIMKIVTPSIIRPWRQRIAAVSRPDAGLALLDSLSQFRVLDPACGCGNFLYVAYRALRELELELKERIGSISRATGLPERTGPLPYYPLRNLYGLDIEPIAVSIARVTLWMGQRQLIEKYRDDPRMRAEDALPLVDLSNVRQADSLRAEWPEADVIIGNPPFLGASHVRGALGNEYTDWLRRAFSIGIKDLCTYWFRKTQDQLRPGQRAGLVGTNSISQNLGRSASLGYLIDSGSVITDAVSTQKWPGDAKVHVSIVNWIKEPAPDTGNEFVLDGHPVVGIDASLREAQPGGWKPQALAANAGRCFEGPSPKAKGLIISADEAAALLRATDTDYRHVVRPYLTSADIADAPSQQPSRWVIDFGIRRLEEAMRFPAALAIVREWVRPERERNNRKSYREKWWIFAEPRTAMRAALAPLSRYIGAVRHGKRLLLCWCAPWTLASDATNVFAFEDDYSMGVLTSRAHDAWAWHQSSTLKGDLRYTPTSAFMTFPWPDPVSSAQRDAVAAASVAIYTRRSEICLAEQIGLTTLYNRMDDGAYTDLKRRHRELDVAVTNCYGWPAAVAQDDHELVRRLTELNRQIATGGRPYDPF